MTNLLDVNVHAVSTSVAKTATASEAPSPFLPGTNVQFAWDSTSLGYLKTCPRLYYYHMIEGWRGKGENIHLRFGIEYHQALQDYDVSRAQGIKHVDAVHDTLRCLLGRIVDWDPIASEGKRSEELKTKPALIRTVLWYLDKFEDDPAQTVILENGKPAVEVSFRFEMSTGPQANNPDNTPYLLCGHLDRIVDFGGELYVMDRKTTTGTATPWFFNQFEPNNQMTLYSLASQIVIKAPIRGVIIDAAQIGRDKSGVDYSRFVRGFTYRTAAHLDEWVQDLKFWTSQAENYANFNYWPMNDTACDKYGGCKFREICSKSPQVREQFLKGSFEKGEKWNPLRVR